MVEIYIFLNSYHSNCIVKKSSVDEELLKEFKGFRVKS